jgi:uncharacterized cupin superfamily protein
VILECKARNEDYSRWTHEQVLLSCDQHFGSVLGLKDSIRSVKLLNEPPVFAGSDAVGVF